MNIQIAVRSEFRDWEEEKVCGEGGGGRGTSRYVNLVSEPSCVGSEPSRLFLPTFLPLWLRLFKIVAIHSAIRLVQKLFTNTYLGSRT